MGKIYTNDIAAPDSGKRVAAYARVSLETDKLAHSLAAQTDYYRGFIKSRSDWELAGIYADSFITGTQTSRRPEFQRLLEDCEKGKIDIILCKSISRFARNTVDLLKTVRHLKELGVEIRFEKENINSMSGEGELLLTILASFAQEESRSISENVKWGIRRRFQSGKAQMRNKSVFGYRLEGGKYVIVPEEAEIVRLIFDEYIRGIPLRKISERLRAEGTRSSRGFDFSHSQINYIIHNEIYIGDIVLQKTFVKDFITHSRAKNNGELPVYRMCGCHEPIVDEAVFCAAQEESARRAAEKPTYPFTKKLICGNCGKALTRRSNNGRYACWHCRSCQSGAKLKEDKLAALFGMTNEEFTESVFRVIAHENGALNVEYFDGRTEKWQYE